MQHIDEYLKRYSPDVESNTYAGRTDYRVVMDEVHDGKYVKYEDVKHFLELLAQKVRMF